MDTYVGVTNVRSETLLLSGIKYLSDLKKYTVEQVRAENAHELVRVLETLDLLDAGYATALCAENRKETRGFHRRVDYPYTNPLMNNKFQTIELGTDGNPVLAFREKVRR